MALATVAYRLSTDVSFTAMLQHNMDEALSLAGITLLFDEKTALQKILALPTQIAQLDKITFSCMPWAW